MRITKEQIPEWEELIRILSLYSIYRVSLHKMKGMSKTLSFFKKKNTPYERDSIYSRMIIYIAYSLVGKQVKTCNANNIKQRTSTEHTPEKTNTEEQFNIAQNTPGFTFFGTASSSDAASIFKLFFSL